jgi:hypothetical protein
MNVDYQGRYSIEHLDIDFIEKDAVSDLLGSVDRILIHDLQRALCPEVFRHISRVEIVDPEFYLTVEADTWTRETTRLRENMNKISQRNFEKLEEKTTQCRESYVFATGPSLDRAFEFEFPEESLKIICNSIVQNDQLLSHINPDVLVFADPVFHFGPSQYADEFREDAVETLQTYDCIAAIPDFQQSLLAGHYPSIREQLIGIEPVKSTLPRFPSRNSLDVMATSNIMTLLMLPIASAVTDRVQIIGADGREQDDSYFWEHSEIAQYDDEIMQSAVETHPSFFRDRIYEDYYQKHVETLTNMIEYGEKHGVEYFSLTDSHIPCLSQRQI